MPALIVDEPVIGACWSKETVAVTADDAGGGTSITAMDKAELRRVRGLTKPEVHAAKDRKDRTIRKKLLMLKCQSVRMNGLCCSDFY